MYNKMTQYTRNGHRWTINECIQLQREFELLNLSVAEIAIRHKRTPNAIMYKLDKEGLADYNLLYSNHYLNSNISTKRTNKYEFKEDDEDEHEDELYHDKEYISNEEEYKDEEEYDDDLKGHILRLEKQIMSLTEMFMKFNNNNNKPMFSLFA